MPRTRRPQWILVVAVAALLLLSACREGLAFRDRGRLVITHPEDRTAVAVPFELAWTGRDLPLATHFAVLIDQTPPPVGEGLDWFARHDPACQRDPRCPDREYLRGMRVHVTDDTSLAVPSVPHPRRPQERELHDVTVILLDPQGRRLDETAATVRVEVQRGR